MSQTNEEGQAFGARNQSEDYSAGTAMIDPEKVFGLRRDSTKGPSERSRKGLKLDREDKRQLLQDLKTEMKPVVSQLCEL